MALVEKAKFAGQVYPNFADNILSTGGFFMTAKKVWGVVLIVLSLVFVLGGISHYHELTTTDALVQASLRSLGSMKTWFWSAKEAKVYAVAVRNEKVLSVVGILLGISMAVFGTMMLKDEYSGHYRATVDFDPGIDALDDENPASGKFKF